MQVKVSVLKLAVRLLALVPQLVQRSMAQRWYMSLDVIVLRTLDIIDHHLFRACKIVLVAVDIPQVH
jgi:hypothetical protein